LFNLKADPAELNDLSAKNPEKRAAMLKLWDEYVKTNGLIMTNDGPFAKRQP
jgi:arylsulfatase